jgi:alpha/beta hydrolase family protein
LKLLKSVALLAAVGCLAFVSQPLMAETGALVSSHPWQQLPQVSGPIPVTAESTPFLAAPSILEAAGYTEEEFFLSGNANVYDWVDSGNTVKVVAGPGEYVTRVLVRRPRDPARFGGNVELTLLNASLGMDAGAPSDFARMVQQGDVWIGITTKPITVRTLQRFDPVRYASLDWSNPAPPESRCAQPSIIPTYMAGKKTTEMMAKAGIKISWPEFEDGLIWDMVGQLGLLLKSEQRDKILPGFSKPWIFMTGISQSSIYIRTWLAGFHDRYRTPDGKSVYDGYLAIVGPSMARINQCAVDVLLDDPTQKLLPPDVPFISLSAEGEKWQSRYTHQQDEFTPDGGIVSYEVAGASHKRIDLPGLAPQLFFASPGDLQKIGYKAPDEAAGLNVMIPDGAAVNDLVWMPLVRGAWHNLQLWVREGVKPPQAPAIELDENLEIRRDRYGNALGGVRMPYIEAPLAAHTGYVTDEGMGSITGFKIPFGSKTLKALYPDHTAYLAKFSAATDRLLAERWISPEDAAAMNAAAAAAQ